MDWSLPTTSSAYADFLANLKSRDDDLAKMLDVVSTNIPTNAIRWSSANNRFEKYNGTTWSLLTAKILMNVDSVDGCTVDDSAAFSTGVLWTSNKINTLTAGYYTKTEIDAIKALYPLKNGDTGTLTLGTNDASALNLETNATNRISIASTGNVTIAAPSTGDTITINTFAGAKSIVATGNITGTQLTSSITTGTPPLVVTSTTKVANLYVDKADTLATTRTINGEGFNGSANINIEGRLGTTIASAATTTIGTKGLGETIHISGTTTISSFGVSNTGTIRNLVFDGALTITYNATSMITPGATSAGTSAGMSMQVVCENGSLGYWRITSIMHPALSSVELGYLDGATSNLQQQIANKANSVSPTLSGTPITPTATSGTDTTQIASTAYVMATIPYLKHIVATKSAPTDTDELSLLDSAVSFSLKKFTWGNLKAALFGSVTSTEIGYLSGVTSSIQSQITARTAWTLVTSGTIVQTISSGNTITIDTNINAGTSYYATSASHKYMLTVGTQGGFVNTYPLRSRVDIYPAVVVGLNNGTASEYTEGDLMYRVTFTTIQGSGTYSGMLWSLYKLD